MQLSRYQYSSDQIALRTGRLQQVCGARSVLLQDGGEHGVRAIDLWTERVRLTVYPDRGMDIGPCNWRGIPIAWESESGPINPDRVTLTGEGWLEGFAGGLSATCGLENVGPPCEEGGRHYGRHGSLSYTRAGEVSWGQRAARGAIRAQAAGTVLTAEGLRFRRRIWVRSGADSVWFEDRISNTTDHPVPWMIQYHMNLGFPLLSEDAEVLIPPGAPTPRDAQAEAGLGDWNRIAPPTDGFREQVFRHRQPPDHRGLAHCAVVNETLGLGVVITYPARLLPFLWQWNMFAPHRYVMGLEPSNCLIKPRSAAQEQGVLPMLEPLSDVALRLQVTFVEGRDGLRRLKDRLMKETSR